MASRRKVSSWLASEVMERWRCRRGCLRAGAGLGLGAEEALDLLREGEEPGPALGEGFGERAKACCQMRSMAGRILAVTSSAVGSCWMAFEDGLFFRLVLVGGCAFGEVTFGVGGADELLDGGQVGRWGPGAGIGRGHGLSCRGMEAVSEDCAQPSGLSGGFLREMEACATDDEVRPAAGVAEAKAEGKLWRPRRVLITPDAYALEHGRVMLARAEGFGAEVVRLKSNRLMGLGAEDERKAYALAKTTFAIVVSPPGQRKLQPIPPECGLAVPCGAGVPGALPVLLPGGKPERAAGHAGLCESAGDPGWAARRMWGWVRVTSKSRGADGRGHYV